MEAKRIMDRGLWVAGGLLILAAAGAWGKGGCGKTESEVVPTVCATPADCEGLPHILCVGGWQCIDGACLFQCDSCEDLCRTDSECGPGMRCSVEECLSNPCTLDGACHGRCVPDSKPTCIQTGCSGEICASAPAYSYCIWQPWFDCLPLTKCGQFGTSGTCGFALTQEFVDCVGNSGMCQQDTDCPAGFACELTYDCGPWMDGLKDCVGGGRCVVAAKPKSCKGDWDCGPYEYCQIQTICECAYPAGQAMDPAPSTGAAMPCGPCQSQGVCQPRPAGCRSDAECAPGERCVFDAMPVTCNEYAGTDVACAQAWVGDGHCEPSARQCWSDADCAPSEMCQFQDMPMPCADPATGEAVPCGAAVAPMGVCVPRPVECWSNWDCGPGYVCQFFKDCYGPMAGEAATDKLIACGGVCVPANTGCKSDWECGPGFSCQFSEICSRVDGADCPMNDPACSEHCEWIGTCVPDSPECWSDFDCPAGYFCQFSDYCVGSADAAGAPAYCGGGTCVPRAMDCWTDADCPAGYRCEISDWCGGVAPSDRPAEPVWCGSGTCVKNAVDCWSDYDCPAGQVCVGTLACPECPDCPGGGDCKPCPPCMYTAGHCEPQTVCLSLEVCGNWVDDDCDGLVDEDCFKPQCFSDADCGPYEVCQAVFGANGDAAKPQACCMPNELCLAMYPPCYAVCVTKPGLCFSDADCGQGAHCEGAFLCGCHFGECDCAPDKPGTCVKDAPECVALKNASHGSCKMLLGFIFNGYECVAEGGCSCGKDCPFFFGSLKECQDACKVGMQCWSNADCPAGQACAVMKCGGGKCMGPWECVPLD